MNRLMKILLKPAVVVFLLLLLVVPLVSQLQQPVAPVNVIIDSDMSNSVDDVGDHAVMWALVNRGEINVLAEVCSSANDFSAPLMHAIATYYGHPNVPIGALKGATPNLENSAASNYTQQTAAQFGIPNDTRANYPDPVTVYRQALTGAPDHSVYIVANGFWQPLQGLLQSPADSISPLNGVQLVAQKVVRLVAGAGFFPSGNEHNMRVDADAAKFVYANWPVEIVNVGVEVSQDVTTGPDFSSNTTVDPIKASYIRFNGGNPVPGFGQMPLLFAARGLAANFQVVGLNGQTAIEGFSEPTPGQNNWFQTPQVGDSYLAKQAVTSQFQAILNPLLQGSSTMPILRGISPTSMTAGGSGQTITLTGTNFFSDSQVQFSGSNRPTNFVSATQLTVQLSSSDVAQAGTPALTVINAEGLGWNSNAMNLAISPGAPVSPTLSAISPTSVLAGNSSVALTVTGANFASTSAVQANGANLGTTFVSNAELTTTIPGSALSTAGSVSINVSTPGGGTSTSLAFTVNNPAPSLVSLSPATTVAGSGALTVTVNGSNFVSGSVVQVDGSARATTFVGNTQLTAAIPAGDVASSGTLSITVANSAPGGGVSAAVALGVTNPIPTLTSISPSTTTAGGAAFTLTVNGSNFVNGSVVQVNGSSRSTTFVGSTQLTASVAAGDIASAGTLAITVVNPGNSASSPLSLVVNNPVPTLTSISPSTTTAGGAAFTLTVNGSNFVNGSVVQVNGSSRSTTFVGSTQLTASVAAGDIASAGTLAITVVNPGNSASSPLSLVVNNPVPTLTSISPSATTVGGPAFTLTVNGSNFVNGSVIQVNGSNRTTTFVSSTQLTAAVAASDIASAGTLAVTVVNPGSSASGALSLVVNNPIPTLASISPNAVTVGGSAFTLTVNGSSFVNGSVVQVNGLNRTTTFVSSTQLSAAIPASDIASVSALSISVKNPTPGGGTSAVVSLAVNNSGPNPQPTLSSLSPDSVIAGSGTFTLTLNGTNFIPSSSVQVDGSNRTTTFVSSTQLKAAIPAGDVVSAAFLSISVTNPPPNGGVWALTFAVNNPLPELSSLSPDSVIAGSGAFTLTVNGTNFIPASVVQMNGSNRTTTFVSSTQLKAAIPASDVASASFPSVSVVNPGPGGGVWSLTFAVNNPLPTISSLSPETVTAGRGGFTLVINGTNFIPASVVQVNGSNRTTSFVSSTQLQATIPASDVASPADLSISVTNPGPGGGVWAMTLPVN